MPIPFDILGLGSVAIDEVLYVDHYPKPDTKTRCHRRLRQCGGLTATALITAARMGCHCAYAGSLGQDAGTEEVLQAFRKEGVNVDYTLQRPEGGVIETTIVVDESAHTRTIIFDLSGSVGAGTDHPPEDLIRSSRLLFVDHYGIEGMIRAARIARDHAIPVVADLERNEWPGFSDLLALVDHLILACPFASRVTGESEPEATIEALWNEQREIVVLTDGANGCWYRSRETGDVCHFPAYRVEVADTTGCGDVFHGTYAWGLLEGMSVQERIRYATASAGLKATRYGGQPAIPTLGEVEQFLKRE